MKCHSPNSKDFAVDLLATASSVGQDSVVCLKELIQISQRMKLDVFSGEAVV